MVSPNRKLNFIKVSEVHPTVSDIFSHLPAIFLGFKFFQKNKKIKRKNEGTSLENLKTDENKEKGKEGGDVIVDEGYIYMYT